MDKFKTAGIVVMLMALIVVTIFFFGLYYSTEEAIDNAFADGVRFERRATPVLHYFENEELRPFIDYLEIDYMYILDITPAFIINLDYKDIQHIYYNITFYRISLEDSEQDYEIWVNNYTTAKRLMTFNIPNPNRNNCFKLNTLYEAFYIYDYGCYTVLHYNIVR